MGKRRKRASFSGCPHPKPRKRVRIDIETGQHFASHPTLAIYYAHISTLRNYLLSKLPSVSKSRRRRIASIGQCRSRVLVPEEFQPAGTHDHGDSQDSADNHNPVTSLLDSVLVCATSLKASESDSVRAQELDAFSQQASHTAGSSTGGQVCSQSDVCHKSIKPIGILAIAKPVFKEQNIFSERSMAV